MSKKPVASSIPVVLMVLGLVLIIGAVGWYFLFQSSPGTETEAPQSVAGNPVDVPRVSLEDAKAAYEIGSAVFLDVRDAGDYTRSHISGAISIPLEELGQRMGELDRSDWIITYCT